MATSDGDRTKFFPAIEKKHGGKISQWITRVKDLGDVKYPEQIAYLREEHGFSQAHANALVMYVRGSTTSKRFATPAEYFKSLDAPTAKTSQAIFAAIQSKFPQLDLVIAWNQPILRIGNNQFWECLHQGITSPLTLSALMFLRPTRRNWLASSSTNTPFRSPQTGK